jgi:hypothetical protein
VFGGHPFRQKSPRIVNRMATFGGCTTFGHSAP